MGRSTRGGLAVLVAGLLAVMTLPSTPARAAGTQPDVTSLTVPSTTVDCEAGEEAWFTAHLTDTVGIRDGHPETDEDFGNRTYLRVEGYAMSAERVSGIPTDGTWRFGPFCIFRPSGTWDVTSFHLVTVDGRQRDVSAASKGFATRFSTVGRYGAFSSIVPASNIDTVVPIGSSKTIHGTVSWYWYGAHPVPGQALQVWEKVPVTPSFPEGEETLLGTTTTGSDGSWSFSWAPTHNSFRTYVTWNKGTTPAGIRYRDGIAWTQRTSVRSRVGLRSVPTSLPAGTVGHVEGNVVPNKAGRLVYLQRLKRDGWATVSRATIRSSSRFSLDVQPPTTGRFSYRVYKAGDAANLGVTTAAFTVTGT
jgi:hypothetical protein